MSNNHDADDDNFERIEKKKNDEKARISFDLSS